MGEFKGTIKQIGQTVSVGTNGFTKRELVVNSDEQYSQPIPVDFVKDKCAILDNYRVGDYVTISYNLRGNEYNGKHYVGLQGWFIKKETNAPVEQQPADNF